MTCQFLVGSIQTWLAALDCVAVLLSPDQGLPGMPLLRSLAGLNQDRVLTEYLGQLPLP